jgi:hypothetical protein
MVADRSSVSAMLLGTRKAANEIQDELSDLVFEALFPSTICDEPIIYPSCPIDPKNNLEPQTLQVSGNLHKNQDKYQGDMLICGLGARRTNCIIDIRITDVDAKSNCSKDPVKVLSTQEWEKKKKYIEAFLKQCQQFTTFVVSTDGLLGKEANTLLKKILVLLAKKWEKLYSEVCG